MHFQSVSTVRQGYCNRVEYQLRVQPDLLVGERVREIQQMLSSCFNYASDREERPYIAIAQFWAKEQMEETLVRWVGNICKLQRSFLVELNNFSAVPPGTLFLRVQNPEVLQPVARQLRMLDGFIEANDCSAIQLLHPRMIIAAGLPDHEFQEAAFDCAAKSFYETFSAEKLVLVKRAGATEPFELVNTFTLIQSREEAIS